MRLGVIFTVAAGIGFGFCSGMVPSARADCLEWAWTTGDVTPGTDGWVSTTTVWSGDLIVGGAFDAAGGVRCDHVARYDGQRWYPLGDGPADAPEALVVYNGELIAGHSLGVERWDGTQWVAMGGPEVAGVYALAVYDGELIAGGSFRCNGSPWYNVVRWTGMAWEPLGSGTDFTVKAMVVYRNELVVGGEFTLAGDECCLYLARWDGEKWSALGSGTNEPVSALAVWNNTLVAGGGFSSAGGRWCRCVARWDGSSWAPMGSGFESSIWPAEVRALTVWNGEVIAGGAFDSSGERVCNQLARWDGVRWQMVGGGVERYERRYGVETLGVWRDRLVVGGDPESTSGGTYCPQYVTCWDGATWDTLGRGFDDWVSCLQVSGGQLYAGGAFTSGGGRRCGGIAQWVDETWVPVGSGIGMTGDVAYCMVEYGGDLIIGGLFDAMDGVTASAIARWDGSRWSCLGSGLAANINPCVHALARWNTVVVAGGRFDSAGDCQAKSVAAWDGAEWQPVGAGFDGTFGGEVYALAEYNGDLIAGGSFGRSGEAVCRNLARYDANGNGWVELGGGVSCEPTRPVPVSAIMVYNNDLIVGGAFTMAGDIPCNGLARWDGQQWHALGNGAGERGHVESLAMWNGRLVAVGRIEPIDGARCAGIAYWDDVEERWRPLAATFEAHASEYDSPYMSGAIAYKGELFAAGHFTVFEGQPAGSWVRSVCQSWQMGDLNCDGSVDTFDIDPFVLALTAPESYEAMYQNCSVWAADVDGDGRVNTFDIDPFVRLLVVR